MTTDEVISDTNYKAAIASDTYTFTWESDGHPSGL